MKSKLTVNRAYLQTRLQEHVDQLQESLVELECSRYPNSPLLGDAYTKGGNRTILAAGISMQIQALSKLAESFRIYLRFEAKS
jgi:coenzyme F420-reducing hydrogenase beta subunit